MIGVGTYVMHIRTNRMATISHQWGADQGCIHFISGGYLACKFTSLRELTEDEIAWLENRLGENTEASLAMDLMALEKLRGEVGI